MKIFKVSCIDSVSGCEMVACDISYNFACNYISDRLKVPITRVVMEPLTGNKMFYDNGRVTYIYDEKRSYLLKPVVS